MADARREEIDAINGIGNALGMVLQSIENAHRDTDYSDVTEWILWRLEQDHQRFFSEGRDANGQAWRPLRPSTIKRKGHGIILVETERLMNSLTRSGGDAIRAHNARGAVFGTRVPYSIYHQLGTAILPQRAPVGVEKATQDDMVTNVADHAVRALKG